MIIEEKRIILTKKEYDFWLGDWDSNIDLSEEGIIAVVVEKEEYGVNLIAVTKNELYGNINHQKENYFWYNEISYDATNWQELIDEIKMKLSYS